MRIHQEALIAAEPQQVFELLTSGSLFSAATGQAGRDNRSRRRFLLRSSVVGSRVARPQLGTQAGVSCRRGVLAQHMIRPGSRAPIPRFAFRWSEPATERDS